MALVWIKTQMHEYWHLFDETNISNWLSNVIEKMDQGCFEFGMVVIWAIWNNCNIIVMNEKHRDN